VVAAYDAHPLLDPQLPSRHRALARLWVDTYRRMTTDLAFYDRIVRGYVLPAGSRSSAAVDLAPYFHDADAYLNDLIRLVPLSLARHLAPLPETRGLSTIKDLLRATFEGRYARSRYEAQRKLCLAKLIFDIDHSRSVRDGPKHRARFEQLVQDLLLSDIENRGEVEIFGVLARSDDGTLALTLDAEPNPGARSFRFRPKYLRGERGDPAVEIFHYRSRFKREADPETDRRADEGWIRIAESPRWPGLGRRSGSILSKMIRARSRIRAWCKTSSGPCSSWGTARRRMRSNDASSRRSAGRCGPATAWTRSAEAATAPASIRSRPAGSSC
jgi:hypothetical protein